MSLSTKRGLSAMLVAVWLPVMTIGHLRWPRGTFAVARASEHGG